MSASGKTKKEDSEAVKNLCTVKDEMSCCFMFCFKSQNEPFLSNLYFLKNKMEDWIKKKYVRF